MKRNITKPPIPTVLVLATGKGGAGKSTLAWSLAGHWLSIGYRVAVVDADPQGTIVNLHDPEGSMRGLTVVADPQMETVSETISELKTRHDIVIVDTAGFKNKTTVMACLAADMVVVPLKPSVQDAREAVAMLGLLRELSGTPERQGRAIAASLVLTMTTPGTVIARHIRKEMEKGGYPLLAAEVAQRVAYPEAILTGAAPSISDPESAASRDIARLAQEIGTAWEGQHVQAA